MSPSPVVPYHGGKSRLASWIASLMPPHRVYIEPFAGSAAVLLAKHAVPHEVLNDADANVVTFYRVLRERPEDLERACRLSPYSRAEFAAADLTDPYLGELERARRWWVRTTQSFAHTGSTSTGWSLSVKRGSSDARSAANRIGRFQAVVERLSAVAIENSDALELITRLAKTSDTVVYADPPYLASTRSAAAKRPGGDYAHEFMSVDQHERLAEVLHSTPSTVLLSGYHSELYDELYAGWDSVTMQVLKRASNRHGNRVVRVDEVVWSNRSLDRARHADVLPFALDVAP